MHLVIGADGSLGRALVPVLRAAGHAVQGTSRRDGNTSIPLDLLGDPAAWRWPAGVTTAYLLAAEASLERCRRQPAETWRLNVERSLLLAERLAQAGIFVVFPSTNHVFDGSCPDRPPDALHAPQTEYGRQKAAVESGLAERGLPHAVVRLSKVMGPGAGRLRDWALVLRDGGTVQAFDDMTVSPVALDMACRLLAGVGAARRGGVWQLSAVGDPSYADLALALCRGLDLPAARVLRHSAAAAGIPAGERPSYTSLRADGIEQFGLQRPAPEIVVAQALATLT